MEYQEYYAEDHQVDEYPSGEMYQEEEPGRMAGFIDSIKTIESDIRAKLTAATEEDEEEKELIETEEQGEEQSLFQKLTGIEISSPFSHNDEEEKTNHTEVNTQEHESDGKSDKSFFDRLTRFDGKKEEGYNVQSSAIQDDAELKDAPKVSNMVALFEQMKGKRSQRKISKSDRLAMEEIDAEKRKAQEQFSRKHEEPGLLDKLSNSFSFTSDEKERETEQEEKEEEEEEVIKDEESTGLLDRLRKFSLATNPSINDEQETQEVDEISEVDEVSEPSLLDQFTTSIKNTFTTETTEDDSIGERITDDED